MKPPLLIRLVELFKAYSDTIGTAVAFVLIIVLIVLGLV
jgi:hypothetical protein